MRRWYSEDLAYRIDEFDDGTRFLLKQMYTNLDGEPVYGVVCRLEEEEAL